jgi:hypothetical protein
MPNPRNSIRSPCASARFMLSKTVSTAISALVFVIPVLLTTSLMISRIRLHCHQVRGDANPTAFLQEIHRLCNQFTIQADLFSAAIRDDTEVPNPLEDSILNIAVIEALFRSARSGKWESPERL